MGDYIENNLPGEFFNPVSNTVPINIDNNCSCCCHQCNNGCISYSSENLDRWKWLISGWDKMDFKERMTLFFPKMHYINLRNSISANFDMDLNNEIIDKGYEYCRDFYAIQFDPDRKGIPNLLIVYKPIKIKAIPSEELQSKIIDWGKSFGFI